MAMLPTRPLATLLLATLVGLGAACSERDAGKSGASPSRTAEALPEAQVVDIVNAVNDKEVAKVTALLKANPKLVHARFTRGGPYDGWPLLMIAAHHGDKPMVDLLLASGADVNDTNTSNEVALHYAALYGHTEVVKVLLEHKADVNVKNDADATALGAARSAGRADIVTLLQQAGAKE